MQFTNGRNRYFIKSESSPTNNLYVTHLAIGANIDSDVDCSLGICTSRALRVLRPQTPVWARRSNALHFGSLFVFWSFLY